MIGNNRKQSKSAPLVGTMAILVKLKRLDVYGVFIVLLVGLHAYVTDSRAVTASEERIIVCQPENTVTPYAEDPATYHDGTCPTHPGPEDVPEEACSQCECWSDSNCDTHKKCCYNGCKNTCTDSVVIEPAPIIDWVAEPPRQRMAGNAWLIPGPEDPYTAETCSTTFFEDRGDPLKCPRGYICYIQDFGDEENGIPNSGICIRE